ncbi:MAG: hypothetical protein KGM24_10080 [Elusimicrobia bacterium]|nr:hypothetical protein [Elusimicrobiota bacterium]
MSYAPPENEAIIPIAGGRPTRFAGLVLLLAAAAAAAACRSPQGRPDAPPGTPAGRCRPGQTYLPQYGECY